jgi:tRNA (cytidine/uridine-2'-O-)-methyltransferase
MALSRYAKPVQTLSILLGCRSRCDLINLIMIPMLLLIGQIIGGAHPLGDGYKRDSLPSASSFDTNMRIALYQPDIPQNTGTILRLAACFGVAVDIIGPAGFDMTDKNLRRAGLDYLDHVNITRHVSFPAFMAFVADFAPARLVLATTHAALRYTHFAYAPTDILMFGRESAGVPEHIHAAIPDRVRIPMVPPLRSLNLAVACGIMLAEALRQTDGLPA